MPTKRFCAALPIGIDTANDNGTMHKVTSVNCQLTVSIMAITPISVSNELITCDMVCCSDCCTLSMSLVTRLSSSPAG